MHKPLILMSARETLLSAYNVITLGNNDEYSIYIKKAGGIPVTFMAYSQKEADEAAQYANGLVITGGADVDPALYGEINTASHPGDPLIDSSDLYLYEAFKKANKPVLGICRGIQLIASAEGAKLIQDLPPLHTGVNHNMWTSPEPFERDAKAHECTFVKGTKLHEIFGDSYGVNSYHHQALLEVPEGYKESARSTDGIIEAIENEYVTAVQWHPERLVSDPKHLALAAEFIKACSADKAG